MSNNNNPALSMTKSNSSALPRVNSGTDSFKNHHTVSQKQSQKSRPRHKQRTGFPIDHDYLNEDFSQRMEQQIKQGKKLNGTSRKNQISINHLLEFQSYRDSQEYQSKQARSDNRRRSSSSRSRARDNYISKAHLHGMSFVNVNYKFVVDYRKAYKVQQLDPNVPVDIKDILRIIVPKGNACPICLSDEPIAPRMITSCGHILCLTCLLSLLESEVPKAKKRESSAVIEKYRDCPLCSSVIRKEDIKPVLINNIDERFETPKINDEVVLTLMARPHDKILALPKALNDYHDLVEDFPSVNHSNPDFSQYSRIFRGDLEYLLKMYDSEKQRIIATYEEEKLLYNDDGKFVGLAIKNIDEDIRSWTLKFAESQDLEVNKTGAKSRVPSDNFKQSSDPSNFYYYYQSGFNASSTYVLSSLDIKVLKTAYNNNYSNLPSSVVAKIENIKYEELTSETSTTKFKYLSHLPLGTSIGFMECNWYQNEFINNEIWELFKDDLARRSKNSTKKFRKEEKNRRRALNEEEIRTRTFFERENSGRGDDYYDADQFDYAAFGSLSIIDNRELPPLSSENALPSNTQDNSPSDSSSGEYQTTIWGTKIPKAEPVADENNDDWDAEEMIRKAKEEMDRQERENGKGKCKKKKKKLILLSSNSSW